MQFSTKYRNWRLGNAFEAIGSEIEKAGRCSCQPEMPRRSGLMSSQSWYRMNVGLLWTEEASRNMSHRQCFWIRRECHTKQANMIVGSNTASFNPYQYVRLLPELPIAIGLVSVQPQPISRHPVIDFHDVAIESLDSSRCVYAMTLTVWQCEIW